MSYVYINRTSLEKPFTFSNLLELQTKVLELIRPQNQSALLFAEVDPIITLGNRQAADEKANESTIQKFKSQGLRWMAGERGGNETWHGPGQWVGFILTPLEVFTGDSKGVRKAVYQILENVLRVVQEYEPHAQIEEGDRLGIWSPTSAIHTGGKLVSVGIKVKQGYVTSGFAINCHAHELSFLGINPCGIAGAKPDFLFKNLDSNQAQIEFEKLPSKLASAFQIE